jgi:hypothetical protein
MSRDYGEIERDFIEGLASDSGRDLAGWMALIDGQTFGHRNEMIDWLRQQGLTFAKASRLERIHHNGGRPLYGDKPPVSAAEKEIVVAAPAVPSKPPGTPPPVANPPQQQIPAPRSAAPPAAGLGDLNAFMARAKGYRPLAELLIRNIRTAVPSTTFHVHDTHADLAAPALYGAMAVTAKDVRLALDLGDHPFEGDIKRLKLPGVNANLTHTIILTDARRVDAALLALVAKSALRTST